MWAELPQPAAAAAVVRAPSLAAIPLRRGSLPRLRLVEVEAKSCGPACSGGGPGHGELRPERSLGWKGHGPVPRPRAFADLTPRPRPRHRRRLAVGESDDPEFGGGASGLSQELRIRALGVSVQREPDCAGLHGGRLGAYGPSARYHHLHRRARGQCSCWQCKARPRAELPQSVAAAAVERAPSLAATPLRRGSLPRLRLAEAEAETCGPACGGGGPDQGELGPARGRY